MGTFRLYTKNLFEIIDFRRCTDENCLVARPRCHGKNRDQGNNKTKHKSGRSHQPNPPCLNMPTRTPLAICVLLLAGLQSSASAGVVLLLDGYNGSGTNNNGSGGLTFIHSSTSGGGSLTKYFKFDPNHPSGTFGLFNWNDDGDLKLDFGETINQRAGNVMVLGFKDYSAPNGDWTATLAVWDFKLTMGSGDSSKRDTSGSSFKWRFTAKKTGFSFTKEGTSSLGGTSSGRFDHVFLSDGGTPNLSVEIDEWTAMMGIFDTSSDSFATKKDGGMDLGLRGGITTMPEPTSTALLGIGLLTLGGAGWRRRKKASVAAA